MKLKNTPLFREQCYVDGKWQGALDGATFPIHNPGKGFVVGEVPKMGAAETKMAIEAAAKAWPVWREKTAKERCQILRRWYELVMENIDDLAIIMTTEQGKPLADALTELRYGASFIEWFSEEGKRVYGDIIPPVIKDQRLFVTKQSIGVVAAITPWNFPSATLLRKCAPALAVGCTVVAKPAEATPFSALALVELAAQAGIPPGVFNVITGDPVVIGAEITANPLVRKITFTGSTKVGKFLMAQSAVTVKKVTLELGGNAPFLVFADSDIAAAVKAVMGAKFRNSGQACTCANRIFIEEKIYKEFSAAFIRAVEALKVGDGLEPGVQIGPLINEAAVKKIEEQIQDAVSKGATIGCGGKRHPLGGTFFFPTVLCNVNDSMLIKKEETFGPVAPLFSFKTEEEVIQRANDTEYGLASYVCTKDTDRIFRVSEQLEFGIVSVNGGLFANEVAPFGGFKESGNGREGSKYGVDDYVEIKYTCLNSF
jgi:succinate-semialdehyde dehydrogenase/glutarate-semialdehyde dehydrogenase